MAQPIRLFISRDNARLCQAAGKGHLFTIWSALYRSCSFHCQRSWAQGEMDKIQYLSICFVIKFLNLQRVLFFFFHCHLQEKEKKKKKTRLTKKNWIEERKLTLCLHVELAGYGPSSQNCTHRFIPIHETRWEMSQREQEAELRGVQEENWRGTLKDSSLI